VGRCALIAEMSQSKVIVAQHVEDFIADKKKLARQ
jgi:hypothetical protein